MIPFPELAMKAFTFGGVLLGAAGLANGAFRDKHRLLSLVAAFIGVVLMVANAQITPWALALALDLAYAFACAALFMTGVRASVQETPRRMVTFEVVSP